MKGNFPELLEEAMFIAECDEKKLADRLGVTVQAVNALKKSRKPRKKTVFRVARALNVKRTFFLQESFTD